MLRRGLLLDRDGVVNVVAASGFVADKADFVWQDGIFDLVRAARARGFVPVIVTNQTGIGRGLYTLEHYTALTKWMLERFEQEGAAIERVYFCPFHPEAELAKYRAVHPWRKPAPGMLLQAAADLSLDLSRSIMIGDRWSDIEAGMTAGVGRTVMVGSPSRRQHPPDGASAPAGPPIPIALPTVRAVVGWLEALPDELADRAGPTAPQPAVPCQRDRSR